MNVIVKGQVMEVREKDGKRTAILYQMGETQMAMVRLGAEHKVEVGSQVAVVGRLNAWAGKNGVGLMVMADEVKAVGTDARPAK